jgi:uncharacterized protein
MWIAALTLTAMTLSVDTGGQPKLPVEPLMIETANGRKHAFRVEMAVEPDQIQTGMMYRTSAPRGTGMLFDFGRENTGVAFWMKNTLIPLDMIFIDGKGRIVRIATAKPMDLTPVPAGNPARAVLEIAGGEAKKMDIRAGDRVRHRIFGDKL